MYFLRTLKSHTLRSYASAHNKVAFKLIQICIYWYIYTCLFKILKILFKDDVNNNISQVQISVIVSLRIVLPAIQPRQPSQKSKSLKYMFIWIVKTEQLLPKKCKFPRGIIHGAYKFKVSFSCVDKNFLK